MSSESDSPVEVDYNKGYFNMPRELRAACAQVHKNTAQLVEFIAEQTFGWHSRWVILTYDEIKNGRVKVNGERMGPGSFLTQDKMVRRALDEALAEHLLEIRYLPWGTAYAIHSRFWASSKLIPQWEFFKRTSYSPQDDPIDYTPLAVKKTEGKQSGDESDAQDVQPSVKKTAASSQIDSKRLSERQRDSVKLTERNLDEARPQEARREGIDTSLVTSSTYNKIDTIGAPTSRPPVFIENEERKEDGKDDPAPLSAQEQAEQEAKRLEELAARRLAAEEAGKRHKERLAEIEQLKALIDEKKQAYNKLVTEELRLWGLVKKATSEEKAARETELATFREAMAPFLEEIAGLEQAWRATME